MQMLRLKLVNRLTHDPTSIRNPSQWVASAVEDTMKEADNTRFQNSEWATVSGGLALPPVLVVYS